MCEVIPQELPIEVKRTLVREYINQTQESILFILCCKSVKIMTVEIDKNGQITINAETPIEAFALNEITKKWDKPEKIQESILIKTGLGE